MKFVDEMENLLINDISGILCFLKEIEKNEVLSKIYCVKIRNQDDFMILCENHLIVSLLASTKYNCSAEELKKWTSVFVKDALEITVVKWQNFLFIKFLIYN